MDRTPNALPTPDNPPGAPDAQQPHAQNHLGGPQPLFQTAAGRSVQLRLDFGNDEVQHAPPPAEHQEPIYIPDPIHIPEYNMGHPVGP